jgi:membrane fusion protein, multidrug efflux system
MKHLTAWTIGSVGVAVVAALTVLATNDQPVEAQQRRPDVVNAYDCTIQLIDVVTLAAERPGILENDTPEEGVEVEAGQVIAGLKDGVAKATYEKELEKSLNDVHIRFASKSHEVAVAELAMSEAANKSVPGTVPQVEIQKLTLASQKASLQIEQADFEKRIAELTVKENEEALKTYQVIAPFSGIVSKVFQRKGEAVQQGTPILEVLSTGRLKIEGYVSIPDSFHIKTGDIVQVQLDAKELDIPFKDEILVGKVKLVDPTISEIIGSVKVTAEVPNPRGILRPGLKAKMAIRPSSGTTTVGIRR